MIVLFLLLITISYLSFICAIGIWSEMKSKHDSSNFKKKKILAYVAFDCFLLLLWLLNESLVYETSGAINKGHHNIGIYIEVLSIISMVSTWVSPYVARAFFVMFRNKRIGSSKEDMSLFDWPADMSRSIFAGLLFYVVVIGLAFMS